MDTRRKRTRRAFERGQGVYKLCGYQFDYRRRGADRVGFVMTPLQAINKAEIIAYDPDCNPLLIISKRMAREIVHSCRSNEGWIGNKADENSYWLEFTLRPNGDLWLHTCMDNNTY